MKLPDCFIHIPGWYSKTHADELFLKLLNETIEFCKTQRSFGKFGPFFNKQKKMGRFGDSNVTYSYKDVAKVVHTWTPTLAVIRDRLKEQNIIDANCVVVNYYGDGTASLYPHTDITYIPQLGKEPTIASVSFGATRDFVLIPSSKKGWEGESIQLSAGDLFVMQGRSQIDWKHGMPEMEAPIGPRLSLTFRKHFIEGI